MAELIVATHHLIQERAQVRVGDDVVIVGPGPMGIMGVQYAKLFGARLVFLIGLKSDEMRLQIGRQVGADVILYSEDGPAETVMGKPTARARKFVWSARQRDRREHAIDCP